MAFSSQDLDAIQQASQQTGVPVELLQSIATKETGGEANPDYSVSSSGALGLFQVLPSTASSPGYGVSSISPASLTDPYQNSLFAAQYLAALYDANNQSWASAISHYSGNSYSLADLENDNPSLASILQGSSNNVVLPSSSFTPSSTNQSSNTGQNVSGIIPSGYFSWLWEYIEEFGAVVLGIILIILGFIWLMFNSKTTKIVIDNVSKAATKSVVE